MEHPFEYRKGELQCGEVSVKKLAEKYGTPLIVTDKNYIVGQYARFAGAFEGVPNLICYAVKANFNLSIVRILGKLGAGADVGGRGELYRVLKAGISPEKIIMSGVGKTVADIESGLKAGILLFKVESLSEILHIERRAEKLRKKASIAIRINPRVEVRTHAHISTGGIEHKFGIDESDLSKIFACLSRCKNVRLVGLDMHIGSQVPDPESYGKAIVRLLKHKVTAEKRGHTIAYLDVGGGFPVSYVPEQIATPIENFADVIIPLLQDSGATVIYEPGRYLVGNASLIATLVLTIKNNAHGKRFTIVDAGMTELMRPALYQAYHHIVPVTARPRKIIPTDIVGPVCESTDVFARDRKLAEAKEGEYLAILSCGAYAATMSSNYNGRLRPAEILVDGKKTKVIRKRETLEQMIQNEN